MACQHSPDDKTLWLQAVAGKDDFIHIPSSPDRVACECQEEENFTSMVRLEVVTVGTVVFVYVFSVLLAFEPTSRLVPTGLAICVDHDVIWPLLALASLCIFAFIAFQAGH